MHIMKNFNVIFLSVTALALASAQDSSPRMVMVVPFENVSTCKAMVTYDASAAPQGTEQTMVVVDRRAESVVMAKSSPARRVVSVDRYSEAPRGLLEDILSKQAGITLVERRQVDSLLLEQQFSGFSDPKEAVAMGKMAGAQFLVTGTIQDVAAREKSFNGYGVSVRNVIVTASVRIRAIEIATGRIIASTTVDGCESFTASAFGGTADSDVAFRVITNAVNKVKEDTAFLAQVAGRSSGNSGDIVAILIDPKPSGSDILLDGAFVGNSPQTINMQVNKATRLTLRHVGYLDWANDVMPREGMHITPTLAEKP